MISLALSMVMAWGLTGMMDEPGAQPAVATMMEPTKAPLLEITKTCPDLRYLGREATFQITVTNRGEGAAANVTVTDVIAGGTEFISADNNGVREGANVVWRVGTLKPGESRVLKTTARCNQIGRVRNTVTASYCVEVAAGCEFEVRGIPAILLECVDEPDPIEVGGNVTYNISVTNQGSMVGTNIVIKATLPPQQEYVQATGPTAATAAGKVVTFASLASLPAGATTIYKVTAKGVKEGDVRFAVELTSDQIQTPVNETESTHIY